MPDGGGCYVVNARAIALGRSNQFGNRIRTDVNEKGHVVIDEHLHPDLYNWAVNE